MDKTAQGTSREDRTPSAPAPWSWKRLDTHHVSLYDANGMVIAKLRDVLAENYRPVLVMAAAPELLEALVYASEASPPNDPDQDDSDLIQIEVTAGWVRELREAIAKAGA